MRATNKQMMSKEVGVNKLAQLCRRMVYKSGSAADRRRILQYETHHVKFTAFISAGVKADNHYSLLMSKRKVNIYYFNEQHLP